MSSACIFCGIVSGDIPAFVVLDEPLVLGFLDTRPLFHGHVLLVPRAHVPTLGDAPTELVPPLFLAARRLARALERGLAAEGTFVAMNNRGGQSVPHPSTSTWCRAARRTGSRASSGRGRHYASDAEAEAVRDTIVAALRDE